MKNSKFVIVLILLGLAQICFSQSDLSNDNPMLKLRAFCGDWNYVEYIKKQGDPDYIITNRGTSSIQYTSDSLAIVVEEFGDNGHLFKGIHNYNKDQGCYNNYAIESHGGVNVAHYKWDDQLNRGIWFDLLYINPSNSNLLYLYKDGYSFSAEWFFENPNTHIFQTKTLKEGLFYYSKKVVYTRK
jgi:hypothetical protein